MIITTTPEGPWTSPINWSLRATDIGEIYTPFALYVRPDCTYRTYAAAFPLLCKLPTELQVHVLRFCDGATLFQLMRTSSTLRHEASKLFWSYPDTWYRIDGYWLLAGGFPGDAYHDPRILGHLQQIEVHFEDTQSLERDFGSKERLEHPCREQEERIRIFWQVLQSRLPRAVTVVLSEGTPRRTGSSSPGSLRKMVQACPMSITAFVSAIETDAGHSNQATRYRARPTNRKNCVAPGSWEIIDPRWTRHSIQLPPKVWRGLVGAYARVKYQSDRYRDMRHAFWLLLIEANERYHFSMQSRPLSCPGPGCKAHFERPGQWALHAVEVGHNWHALPPALYQEAFTEHERMREHGLQEDVYNAAEEIRRHYGKPGSLQQQENHRAFLHQLEHDPLYAHDRPNQEESIWLRYLNDMQGEE